MIYSDEINKICALCRKARSENDTEIFCERKNKFFSQNNEACKKFEYDILKKKVKRMRALKTNFKKEDFTL